MNEIEVKGIRGYGFHGCMDEEARIGQLYVVDVRLTTDFIAAAENDDLHMTVDYVEVNRIVQAHIKQRSKLIETVTLRIARDIKELQGVSEVTVRVTKPAPPINGDVDSVSTTVTI